MLFSTSDRAGKPGVLSRNECCEDILQLISDAVSEEIYKARENSDATITDLDDDFRYVLPQGL